MSLIPTLVARSEGFTPPGPGDFNLPPVGPDRTFTFLGQQMYLGVTKPMLLLVLSAALIFLFFRAASAKRAMVPGKTQFIGEMGYTFVRNQLGRDIIGSKEFMRFVPFLFVLFFFVLVNNLFATIPLLQFPTFSRAGLVYGLVLISWLVYNIVGIKAQGGVLAYLKHQTVPPGVHGPMLALLIPLEFFSNILVRPLTLALRLFANMLAGHILLILFALGGEYLLVHGEGLVKPVGIVAWLMFIVIAFLEVLVQVLQAYVFTLLSALYISGAIAEEH
ncbi:MAG: synthase subunit a [Marmoricola sp.]|nr:synthase subunit a [Marmoricola sp.]